MVGGVGARAMADMVTAPSMGRAGEECPCAPGGRRSAVCTVRCQRSRDSAREACALDSPADRSECKRAREIKRSMRPCDGVTRSETASVPPPHRVLPIDHVTRRAEASRRDASSGASCRPCQR